MSIESKHRYRFRYLKSEKWQNVRLEALVREQAKCEICKLESISNDAHHVWYPKEIYDTTPDHLAILCRACHEFCHIIFPECKTRHKNFGRQQWIEFKNAIIAWRIEKIKLFTESTAESPLSIFQAKEIVHKVKISFLNTQKDGIITLKKDDFCRMFNPLHFMCGVQKKYNDTN